MLKKIPNRDGIRVFKVFLIAPTFFLILFLGSVLQHVPVSSESKSLETSATDETLKQPSENLGVRMRIKIPAIHVNAEVEKVALAPDGSMGVPKDPLNAGWYELGPRPGDRGSAVIAGHLNWYDGQMGAFADLYKVKPGDEIVTHNEEGLATTFIVRETKMYDAETIATDVFVSTDGKAHLNLVTCSGIWDKSTKQYSKRLVVFAEMQVE